MLAVKQFRRGWTRIRTIESLLNTTARTVVRVLLLVYVGKDSEAHSTGNSADNPRPPARPSSVIQCPRWLSGSLPVSRIFTTRPIPISHPTIDHSHLFVGFIKVCSLFLILSTTPSIHPRANGMQAANYGIGMSGRERSLAGSISDMSNLVD